MLSSNLSAAALRGRLLDQACCGPIDRSDLNADARAVVDRMIDDGLLALERGAIVATPRGRAHRAGLDAGGKGKTVVTGERV